MSYGEEWSKPIIRDFSGGMNLKKSPILLAGNNAPNNEVVRARNFVLDDRGAIRKRLGYTAVANSTISGATGIQAAYRWQHPSGSITIVAAKTATYTKIYSFDGSTMTEITGGTALASGDTVRFIDYRDYLFIYNGTVFQYMSSPTATTKADVVYTGAALPAAPRLIEIADDKIFAVVNNSTYRYVVFFSIVGGWTTNPGTDMEFVSGDDFDVFCRRRDATGVTALLNYGNNDDLIAFLNMGNLRLLGNASVDYELQQSSRFAGTVGAETLTETDDGRLIHVGKNNVFMYNGEIDIPVGDNIRPLFDGVDFTGSQVEYWPEIDSVVIPYSNGCLVWHKTTGGWTEWDIGGISTVIRLDDSVSQTMQFAFADDNKLYSYGGTTDNGANIEWTLELPVYDMGDFTMDKQIAAVWAFVETDQTQPFLADVVMAGRDHTVSGDSNTITMLQGGPLYDVAIYDVDYYGDAMPSIGKVTFNTPLRGSAFTITLSNTSDDAITIYAVAAQLKPLPAT